ncbi:MAG: DUF535 domain-containing protein [Hymenobacter sp.]|nr:MAG: DUF535 domain-containing protein [Hymenobacter sp.]
MKKDYPSLRLVDRLRDLLYWPGLLQLKYLFRQLQALVHHAKFGQLRQLVATLPLEALLAHQPRFLYKYLGYYGTSSFPRPVRHAAILHHYQYLGTRMRPDFFCAGSRPAHHLAAANGRRGFRYPAVVPATGLERGRAVAVLFSQRHPAANAPLRGGARRGGGCPRAARAAGGPGAGHPRNRGHPARYQMPAR